VYHYNKCICKDYQYVQAIHCRVIHNLQALYMFSDVCKDLIDSIDLSN